MFQALLHLYVPISNIDMKEFFQALPKIREYAALKLLLKAEI
jgi:hypothetical protein